jgi:hypothetical protein
LNQDTPSHRRFGSDLWSFLPAITPITPSAIGLIIVITQHNHKYNIATDTQHHNATATHSILLQLSQRFYQVRTDTFILLSWLQRVLLWHTEYRRWRRLELTFDAVVDSTMSLNGLKHKQCRVATPVLSCHRSR